MLPRSAANATKPVSYRQRGETGHSPAKGWAADSNGIPVTDWTQVRHTQAATG